MARSSQDASAVVSTRRKTTHVEAKDKFLYERDTRMARYHSSPPSRVHQQYEREEPPVSFDARHRQGASSKPRYSDSVVPLKDGDSSYPSRRGENRHPENTRTLPTTSTRTLQSQVSLSNMFEEAQAGQSVSKGYQSNAGVRDASLCPPKPAQVRRMRSLSDTSLYSRQDRQDETEAVHASTVKGPLRKSQERKDDYEGDGDDFDPTSEKTLFHSDKKGKKVKGQNIGDGGEDGGDATLSLTEFARLEKSLPMKQCEIKEKTLVELAEPLIQDVTEIYEAEWEEAIIAEEKLYKETAKSLGALLDNEMMEAAYGIKKDIEKCTKIRIAVKDAIAEETAAAKEQMMSLIMEQKRLVLELRQVEERISKRDERIMQELHDIHNKSVSEQQEIEDEYGSKADALEDRIEAMKSEKGLKNDFNNYLGRFMNAATTDREKPASKNKNARRATRA